MHTGELNCKNSRQLLSVHTPKEVPDCPILSLLLHIFPVESSDYIFSLTAVYADHEHIVEYEDMVVL